MTSQEAIDRVIADFIGEYGVMVCSWRGASLNSWIKHDLDVEPEYVLREETDEPALRLQLVDRLTALARTSIIEDLNHRLYWDIQEEPQ